MVNKSGQAGAHGSGRRGFKRGKPFGLDLGHVSKKSVGHIVRSPVVKGRAGPFDAALDWRPDPKERTLMWKGKPPPFDEGWHRRVYNMNKKLTDDLCGGIAVEIPGYIAFSPLSDIVRNNKHRP